MCSHMYYVQVNLPAHLVVIKSTSHYVQGMFQEYTESQVLQMIGRAGRPQVMHTALNSFQDKILYSEFNNCCILWGKLYSFVSVV